MNTTSFLQKNIEALVASKGPIVHWLHAQKVDAAQLDENIFKNRWNLVDYKLSNGKGMFEAMPPISFYKDWVAEEKSVENSITFIVGCNVGYGLNHVLSSTPNRHKVVMVEPDPTMLLACLSQSDYSPYITMGKLFFLPPDKEILRKAIQMADMQFLFGKMYLRSDVPSQQLSPEYAVWTRNCQDLLENFAVELATLRKQQDTMVSNELENFQDALANGSVKCLKGAAKGLTAVLLAAGPSLAKYGPELAKQPDNALYVTSLQTLPSLKDAGIKPHVAMAIDYSTGMRSVYKNLDKEWAKDIPLLYSIKLDPQVVRDYPGPKIPVWTQGGLGTFIMKDRELVLDAGGNVSVSLMRLLHWCGIENMLLVGQDFAWKGESSHAKGHLAYDRKISNTMKVKDVDGNPLVSTISYISALRDMERDVEQFNINVYNLYGGGVVIKGTEHVDVRGARELLQNASAELHVFLRALQKSQVSQPMPQFQARAQNWASSLRSVQKRLDKLFKKSTTKQKEIWKALQDVHAFIRHDPLCLPYLFNEVMDMGGLMTAGKTYGPKELVDVKNILKRVTRKVKHLDDKLGATPRKSPRAAKKRRQAA